jgi:oxygen-independent coproporphyrinogen-3 oxidase
LSIEEGTLFYSEAKAGRLALPPETLQAEMYLKTVELLEKSGFKRYEISNFALPGYECRHNLNYWTCGYYLGFGAGAWSYPPGVRLANERT